MVSLDSAPTSSVSVTLGLSPLDASRYGPPSSTVLTFLPGGPLTQSVSVPVLNDGVTPQAATAFSLIATSTGLVDMADPAGLATIAAN